HRLLEFFLAEAGFELFDAVLAGGNNDLRNQRAGSDAAHAENSDGHAVEFQKLLRGLGAHACSETGGGKDGGNLTHSVTADRLKRHLAGPSAGCRRESVPQERGGRKMGRERKRGRWEWGDGLARGFCWEKCAARNHPVKYVRMCGGAELQSSSCSRVFRLGLRRKSDSFALALKRG